VVSKWGDHKIDSDIERKRKQCLNNKTGFHCISAERNANTKHGLPLQGYWTFAKMTLRAILCGIRYPVNELTINVCLIIFRTLEFYCTESKGRWKIMELHLHRCKFQGFHRLWVCRQNKVVVPSKWMYSCFWLPTQCWYTCINVNMETFYPATFPRE
jgi:hypothetical protein